MKKVLAYIGGAVYIITASMLVFGATLNAYVDPSAVTFLISAISGVVVALGAAIGIYWRKAKKKVAKTLNIDENKNKDVESDDIVIAETDSEEKENAKV